MLCLQIQDKDISTGCAIIVGLTTFPQINAVLRKGKLEQKKCKRSTGTETVPYLREKTELRASLKREELQLRKAELDEKKIQQEHFMAQQDNLTKMLCETLKSQQTQQEQMLQQMQLQNTALLTLMQSAVSKQKET